MTQNLSRQTLLMFAAGVLITGTNFVAVKFSNQELAPFWGAGLRFFIASLLFFLFLFVKRVPLLKGSSLKGALLYGVVGFGMTYALLYWALQKASAGVASVTIALVPLLTHLLAVAHKVEAFNLRILGGSLVAALGIGLIFSEQLSFTGSAWPLLALIAAAVFAAETGIIIKLFGKSHPAAMNAFGMLAGAGLLFLLSQLMGEVKRVPAEPETLVALAYLVLVGSITLFVLVVLVVQRWTASAASYQLVLAPLVTLVVAAFLRGEAITAISLIGSLVVLFGVYIGALTNSRR